MSNDDDDDDDGDDDDDDDDDWRDAGQMSNDETVHKCSQIGKRLVVWR